MKESYRLFHNKFCKCELKTGFFVYGTVTDINSTGIFLTTDTKTSFIAWDSITQLIPTIDKKA